MAKADYYTTLGVDRSADSGELKSAYRKLAMKYHPDRNPNNAQAEAQFKELSEAYDVLKNDQRRAAYDRYGHAAFENGGSRPRGFDFASNFSDVFEDLFGEFMGGGQRQRSAARRGADVRHDLEISLEDCFSGVDVDVQVATSQTCGSCEGSGAEPGTEPEICGTCDGMGKVRSQQGFFMVERTCPSCRGAGRVIGNPCAKCNGQGRMRNSRKLEVTIPKGVETGTRIRLSGEGEAGYRGGPAGDLYIFIAVKPHKFFGRDRTTLHCQVPLPFTQAALGSEIEVPAIDGGRAKIKIPAGTQSGKQFRLRRKGMPQLNSSLVGDMILEVRVETAVNLTKKQKELLKEFEAEGGANWSPESESFFSRVREFWDDLTE